MNKIIKTFLVLSFITATCWAYLLGEYMGTVTFSRSTGSPGFQPATFSHSRSTSTSTSTSTSGSIDTSKIDTSGGAVDVSSIDLGLFSSGSSGDITAQSSGGTSGGTVDRTQSIDVSAYAKVYDGNIDRMIAAIKEDFLRAPTAGEYQTAAKIISSENKFSILSVAAVAELHSSWLTDYFEWTKGLTSEQINNIVAVKIDEVAKEYGILPREARALLMEVDAEKAKQSGAPSSLIERLNNLSINDPLFVDAKENVLLQTAIAEAVPETSSGEAMRPIPIMGPFERGDFEANESRAGTYQVRDSNGNLRHLTPAEAREVAIIVHERSGQSGWLSGECPTLGGEFASVIQEVTGQSPMDPYGSAAYEADISRFSNYYQVSEDQAKQAINLLLGDSIIGDEWVQRDPETGKVMVDYLEVGPETGVGYPICPIMSNDIQSYLNYVIGAGPRPEALAPKDIEEITLGSRTTEINIQNKAEELGNEIGTSISEEMMVMALKLAIVDKGLIVTDENVREVISSITLNEVKYYISMINKVAEKYDLTSSEATSVLKVHVSDQRASNPNYKLSEENNIIGSIEANKNTSRLLEIVQEAKAGNIPVVNVDLNRDGEINLIDSAILMSFWGKDSSGVVSSQSPDINQDTKVNLADFSIMMSYWNYTFK